MDSDESYDSGLSSRARAADKISLVGSTQNHSETSRNLTPSSALLHGLLRDKKAENRRVSKVSDLEASNINEVCDSREIQSSPLGPMALRPERTRKSRAATGLEVRSVSVPKEMGLREMEDVRVDHDSGTKSRNTDILSVHLQDGQTEF